MKKEELRIGNLVEGGIKANGKPITGIITALGDNSTCLILLKDGTRQMLLENLKPLKITEEYLIKLGFEKKPFGNEFVWMTKNYIFSLSNGVYYRFKSEGIVSFIYGKLFVQMIRFVHQIQNFHFEMTGEVLVIEN